MGKCKKCEVIRSSEKLFDGFCNRCKDENASNDDEYDSFACEDCNELSPINTEREEDDFCIYCHKALCSSCHKKHDEIKNSEICAFLHENFSE